MQVEDEVTRFNTLKIQENMDEEVALLAGVRVQIKISIKKKTETTTHVLIRLERCQRPRSRSGKRWNHVLH